MDTSDDNLDDIARMLFTNPIQRAKSINLELEELTIEFAQKEGFTHFIFNILCILIVKGIAILYNKEMKINELTYSEYTTIRAYIKSIGYDFIVWGNDTRETPWELLDKNIQVNRYVVSFNKLV